MSRIPDCRTDENYNEKYLNEKAKTFIYGFDSAVEAFETLIEGNIETFPDLETLLEDNTAIIKEGKAIIVKEAVCEWLEMARDEIITSMIDSMDDAEYDAIKEKVDGRTEEEVGQGTGENGEETV